MLMIFFCLVMGSILIKRPNFFPPLIIMFLVTINYDAPNVADFMSYNNIYNSITNKELYQTGYGWYLLNNLGRTLGLDYNHYKMWTIIIAGCCIWMISRILVGKGENFIVGLYLLYPALLDTVQLRFYTAMTIVLVGILFLVKQKTWSTAIFIVFVLMAYTIHSSTIFYAVFALYPIIDKISDKMRYIIVGISILLIVFKSKLLSIVYYVANVRQLQYLDSAYGVTSGSSYVLVIAIMSIVVMYFINNRIFVLVNSNSLFSDSDKQVVSTIRGISLMMFLLIPLVILSGEFFRVFRIIFILSYISIAILSKYNYNYQIKNIKYNGKSIKIKSQFLGLIIAVVAFIINILYLSPAAFDSYF